MRQAMQSLVSNIKNSGLRRNRRFSGARARARGRVAACATNSGWPFNAVDFDDLIRLPVQLLETDEDAIAGWRERIGTCWSTSAGHQRRAIPPAQGAGGAEGELHLRGRRRPEHLHPGAARTREPRPARQGLPEPRSGQAGTELPLLQPRAARGQRADRAQPARSREEAVERPARRRAHPGVGMPRQRARGGEDRRRDRLPARGPRRAVERVLHPVPRQPPVARAGEGAADAAHPLPPLRRHRVPRPRRSEGCTVVAAAGHNPDDDAFLRAVQSPSRGIGATALSKLAEMAQHAHLPLSRAASRWGAEPGCNRAANALGAFTDILRGLRGDAARLPPATGAQAQRKSGLLAALREQCKPRNCSHPRGNLDQLATIQSAATMARGRQAPRRATRTALSRRQGRSSSGVADEPAAAKGLEFRYVFIVGMDDNTLPHEASIDGRLDEAPPALRRITRARNNSGCRIRWRRSWARLKLAPSPSSTNCRPPNCSATAPICGRHTQAGTRDGRIRQHPRAAGRTGRQPLAPPSSASIRAQRRLRLRAGCAPASCAFPPTGLPRRRILATGAPPHNRCAKRLALRMRAAPTTSAGACCIRREVVAQSSTSTSMRPLAARQQFMQSARTTAASRATRPAAAG